MNVIYELRCDTIISSSSNSTKGSQWAGGKYKSIAVFLKIVSYLRKPSSMYTQFEMSNRENSLELMLLSDARLSRSLFFSNTCSLHISCYQFVNHSDIQNSKKQTKQDGLSQNTEVCNFELALWKQELRSLEALIIDTHTISKRGTSKEVTVIPNSHFCVYYTKALMLMMGTWARGEQEVGFVYRSSEMCLWFCFHGLSSHSKQFF